MYVIIIGLTPLHIAAPAGHADILTLLINNKADIEAKDKGGKY